MENQNSPKLTPKEINELENELQDVFNIYLDTDIAGDNDDRRNKLNAFNTVFSKLRAL